MCLAIPGLVLWIGGDDPLTRQGRVEFVGITKMINLAYVPEVQIGDYVLVHAGFAIALVDTAEAEITLGLLAELEPLSPGA
jgi:hydrogenase expression/formation protein HypC